MGPYNQEPKTQMVRLPLLVAVALCPDEVDTYFDYNQHIV